MHISAVAVSLGKKYKYTITTNLVVNLDSLFTLQATVFVTNDEVFHEIFGFGDYDLDRHITRWTGTGCCDGLYWSNGYQSKTRLHYRWRRKWLLLHGQMQQFCL
ncbi:hypothetical protein EB796_014114 [Bugula neritina]|uniref:Uncharacterized protein n=1 Tax=Bugula neritina TaxID=10212 RepID=A0A7J7JNX6_BUGNE|nr:hypothetical protein EB796_014114 [Bugula neritina]